MQLQLYRHYEPLEPDELAFLKRKEANDRTATYKIVRVLMIFCFVIPYILSWFRATNGVPDPFSYKWYFAGVFYLLCFMAVCLYIAYHRTMRKLHQDIRHKTKTIERTLITRKQYVPHNNTYYFYLNSPTKLSIEVSQGDYYALDKGDEVNIEYTTYSNLYLGYF